MLVKDVSIRIYFDLPNNQNLIYQLTKKLNIMKKIFSILAAVLFAGSMLAADATMTTGANGSACKVNLVDGIKCGTSKNGGDMTITVGAGATKLSFYAAAWNGVSDLSLNLAADGVTISPASVSLTADAGISNNSPFTLSGLPENFKFEVDLTGVTAETAIAVTSSAAKRFVVWGAAYETGEVPPTPSINYYVAGSMNSWTANPAYKLTENPKAEGEYMGEFTFAANDAFKVIMDNGSETYTWYPDGVDNNYVITEAGDYTVYFRPAGNVEGWYEGFFYVEKEEPVIPDTISSAQAREAALSGMTDEVIVRGYVTEIVEAWSSFKNVSFWMADTQDGGQVFEAFRVACETAADAPGVGDLVWVKGNLTKYKSTPEIAAGGTFGIIEKSQIVPQNPQNLGEKTIAEFLALKNTIDTCILTGVVDSITNTTYGNLYLSDATGQVYVYGVLTADGQSKKFAELGVEAGDELTVLALYNEYNNKPQVKNAIFVSVTKKDPTAISNTAVEGKAVKALVNGQVLIIKNGKTYNVLGTRVR